MSGIKNADVHIVFEMECATNVNDLCLHNNAGLGDKLGNAGVPATTSTTKPVGIDGETPCGVAQ